jgi:hypothetical protein
MMRNVRAIASVLTGNASPPNQLHPRLRLRLPPPHHPRPHPLQLHLPHPRRRPLPRRPRPHAPRLHLPRPRLLPLARRRLPAPPHLRLLARQPLRPRQTRLDSEPTPPNSGCEACPSRADGARQRSEGVDRGVAFEGGSSLSAATRSETPSSSTSEPLISQTRGRGLPSRRFR